MRDAYARQGRAGQAAGSDRPAEPTRNTAHYKCPAFAVQRKSRQMGATRAARSLHRVGSWRPGSRTNHRGDRYVLPSTPSSHQGRSQNDRRPGSVCRSQAALSITAAAVRCIHSGGIRRVRVPGRSWGFAVYTRSLNWVIDPFRSSGGSRPSTIPVFGTCPSLESRPPPSGDKTSVAYEPRREGITELLIDQKAAIIS